MFWILGDSGLLAFDFERVESYSNLPLETLNPKPTFIQGPSGVWGLGFRV